MNPKLGQPGRDLDCIGGAHVKLSDLTENIRELWKETLSDPAARSMAERASGVSLRGLSAEKCLLEVTQAKEGYVLIDAFIVSISLGVTVSVAERILRKLWDAWLLPKLAARVSVQRLMRQ